MMAEALGTAILVFIACGVAALSFGFKATGDSVSAGVVATALALSRGFLPPTINQSTPDPECDLDFIPNEGREASPVAALCNCLGFGSKNSALVLGKSDG